MLVRFHNFEEACLFVAMKRAEGHFAEVVHQNAGHIWGCLAVNGFAVILSEESDPEGVTVPAMPAEPISDFSKVLGMLGVLGMLITLVAFLFILKISVMEIMIAPVDQLAHIVVFLSLMSLGLLAMLRLTRIYNRPEHPHYLMSRVVIQALAWIMIVMQVPELLGAALLLIYYIN